MLKRPSKSVITPCDVPSTMTLAENIGSPVSPSLTNPTRVVWATMAVDMAHNTSIHPAFPTKDVVRTAGIKKASTKHVCRFGSARCAKSVLPPAFARKVVHGTHEQLVWKSALLGDDAPRFRGVQRHVHAVAGRNFLRLRLSSSPLTRMNPSSTNIFASPPVAAMPVAFKN